jgi:trans-feruloyl-CoA hydratase/vanillin synthase
MALRHTKEAIRSVKEMDVEQAEDYLNAKSEAVKRGDPEKGREKAMRQFLDEKTFKPGFGTFKR